MNAPGFLNPAARILQSGQRKTKEDKMNKKKKKKRLDNTTYKVKVEIRAGTAMDDLIKKLLKKNSR